jgi:hypothetical protein
MTNYCKCIRTSLKKRGGIKFLLAGIFAEVFFFISLSVPMAFAVEQRDVTSDKVVEKQVGTVTLRNSSFGTIVGEIEVGALVRGNTYVFGFDLKNDLKSDLELGSVKTECSCTGAKIPSGLLASGEAKHAEIRISVGIRERKSALLYTAELQTKGAADRVLLRMRGTIENLVAFENDMYSLEVGDSKSEDAGSLLVPILTTSSALLTDCVVAISGDKLGNAEASHVEKDGRHFVLVTLKSKDASTSDGMDFTIAISGKGFEQQTAKVLIRKASEVRVFPIVLNFGSVDFESLQANCVLRISSEKIDASSFRITECSLEKGETESFELTPLSKGVFRLAIKIRKRSEALEKEPSSELRLKYEHSTGQGELKLRSLIR